MTQYRTLHTLRRELGWVISWLRSLIWRCDAGFLRCCWHKGTKVRNEAVAGCRIETDMYWEWYCCRCTRRKWKQDQPSRFQS